MADPTQPQYYWCLVHHQVEPLDGCKAADRLGPYPTAQQAAEAIQHAEANNEAWENDPRYRTDDEDEDEDREGWGPFSR